VINPAEAVARQTKRILEKYGTPAAAQTPATPTCYSSGDPQALKTLSGLLLEHEVNIDKVCWNNSTPSILSICKNRLS
jgi:glutamate racemase